MLHLEGTGCEQNRSASGGRHRVEVKPAIGFPGKDDAITSAPEELTRGGEVLKGAALAFRGTPYFAALPCADIRDADRPGCIGAVGLEAASGQLIRVANERDLAAVGRPRRLVVCGG